MDDIHRFTAYLVPMKENFTDVSTLLRVADMFKEYTLDDAESYQIGERFSNIVFLRNGSRYTLQYDTAYLVDQLVSVTIEPV